MQCQEPVALPQQRRTVHCESLQQRRESQLTALATATALVTATTTATTTATDAAGFSMKLAKSRVQAEHISQLRCVHEGALANTAAAKAFSSAFGEVVAKVARDASGTSARTQAELMFDVVSTDTLRWLAREEFRNKLAESR